VIGAPLEAKLFREVGIESWKVSGRDGTMSRVSRPRAPLTLLALALGFVLGLVLVPGAIAPSAEAQAFRPRGRSAALTKVAPQKAPPPASTAAADSAKTPTRTATTAPAPRKAPAAKPVAAKKAPAKKKPKTADDDDVVVVDDDDD
jgi:hypothetical protein